MGKLSGKIAIVTGGNSGIGLATAKLFAAEGARVVITGRREAELQAAAAEIGHGALGIHGDVSKLADLDKLYAEVKQKFGRIDVLFANAGIAEVAPLEAVTEAHFDKLFDINVKGLLFTVQKALPLIAGGGSIVLNSSVANTTGMADLRRLFGDEGRRALLRPNLDVRIERPQNSGQRRQPRTYRDAHLRKDGPARSTDRRVWRECGHADPARPVRQG